ncbi:Zinc finger BED domain-containing protein 5 [Sarcoptes scabiei]|uniref:Zinc finger BED domain-containing protein 5 n=1 Tax=Sarcoptes scabiei TaxID=52283 RepID=A0A834RDI7_SARSC|nr:Zinc finger BED domain-containing protein 5 [Sarcoptes scabiei]
MGQHQIDWAKCVGICTDGVAPMAGKHKGLKTLIEKRAPRSTWTHCLLHREAEASSYLSPEIDSVLNIVIAAINYIKPNALKMRLFKQMCKKMAAKYDNLKFFCKSRWNLATNWLLHELAGHLIEKDFVIKLAFLCDILKKLDRLNKSLQEPQKQLLDQIDNIMVFKKKLYLCKKALQDDCLDQFPSLHELLTSKAYDLPPNIKPVFVNYLSGLLEGFEKNFPHNQYEESEWIRQPFGTAFDKLNDELKASLSDLAKDSNAKLKFVKTSLIDCRLSLPESYPHLCFKAFQVIIPFSTSRETGFSQRSVL